LQGEFKLWFWTQQVEKDRHIDHLNSTFAHGQLDRACPITNIHGQFAVVGREPPWLDPLGCLSRNEANAI